MSCKNKKNERKLGSGTFGEVFLIKDTNTNKTTAVKVLKSGDKPALEFDSLIEIDVLFKIHSNALVAGIGIYRPFECFGFNAISFEMPYYGSVYKLLEQSLTFEQKLFLIYKLLLGVKSLHDNNILHLDIKPENCLHNGDDLLLTDFGLSMPVEDIEKGVSTHRLIGTIIYRPPEWFSVLKLSNYILYDVVDEKDFLLHRKKLNYVYNNKFDIWSAGITSLYILTHVKDYHQYIPNYNLSYNALFDQYTTEFRKDTIDQTLDIALIDFKGVLSTTKYKELKVLLKGLLAYLPSERMDIDQALECKIFSMEKIPSSKKLITQFNYECSVEERIYFNISELNVNSRYGIKYIIALFNGMFSLYYVRDFFATIDLYMRLLCLTNNLTAKLYRYMALLCVRMIYKYYYNSLSTFPQELENDVIIDMEISAVKYLEGIIKLNNVYDIVESEGELLFYFKVMLHNNLYGYNKYFMVDYEKLKSKRNNKTKIITCKYFFDKVGIEF